MTHENKLGLFIHWGVYALMEYHEQCFAKLDVPREEYESLYKRFNPVNYDPEKWVLLAKNAGMKYICFTAKHHDGFCMWDTKYTDYNIMNTPYGKDVLKMLSDACRKHGMLLSIYYSNPDWHHPTANNPLSSHQWKSYDPTSSDTTEYREYIKKQITELLTNYGEIYTLFWDIPPHIDDPSINELVRRLQPKIFINDRGFSEGDFSTPERHFSDYPGNRFDRMTEMCNSVGKYCWGYRKNEDFHTTRYLTGSIDRIMAMGGSYLLNVGPDANGVIGGLYEDRIKRVGDWYNRMQGALECHGADALDLEISGSPALVTTKNGKSYIHFYDGLMSCGISIKNYPGCPKTVKILNTGATLSWVIEKVPASNSVVTSEESLHILNIPADEIANEAIVIEIEW